MANVTDSFNRADDAATLGNADSGQTWVPDDSGGGFFSVWGISGNRAYAPGPAPDHQTQAYVETGKSDGTVAVKIAVYGGDDGIIFRYRDVNNYLLATVVSGGTERIIYERVAFAFAALDVSSGLSFGDGDVLGVVMSGTSIITTKNGSPFGTPITTSRFQTETKHGIRTYTGATGTTTRFDDFSFTGSGGGQPTAKRFGGVPFMGTRGLNIGRSIWRTLGGVLVPQGA